MSRILLSITAIALLLSCTPASAQDTENFTGTWVMDMKRSESAGQSPAEAPRTPVRLVIEHSPTQLRIDRERNGKTETVTYFFDQSETKNPPTPVGTSGTGVTQARAEWKDGRLTMTTVMLVNGKTVTTSESLTLTPDGREMTVETLLELQHGMEFSSRDAKAHSTGKDVYVKAER